ncbi:MAG TPA: T9SS type A sorting domain-containing protein [Bacteroidia bacterium]|nr:T9SS type A sorting domain-containing protein [Bacteroidia bacterium]
MNKLYISLSVAATLAFSNAVLAQTTITTAVLPQVGYTYNMAADTNHLDVPTFTVSAGSATAQTWDYSTLFANTYAAPLSFVTPAGNPGASSFPNSTLAADQGGGTWAYLKTGASGLLVDGANAVIPTGTTSTTAIVDYVPDEILIPTPFTLNSAVTNVYAATFTVTTSGVTATVHHRAHRTITADAFGSLKTPAGTYANTLRIKTYEITSDSIFVFGANYQDQYDTTTTYNWAQNTADARLMEIDFNKKGAVTKASYLQSFTNAINDIKHFELATNLYPNPASTFAILAYENESSAKVSASIFDVTGRQVATLLNNQQQAAGKQTLAIDVVNLPQGLYMVQLTVNGATKTLKLNVR